jgi:flagellar motor switch protein FliG
MSLLNRYRRKGGFENLLKLVESSTPAKQEQLLKLIEAEDSSWAELIRVKSLSMDKIFSWEPQYLKDIVYRVKPRILGISLIGQSKEVHEKVAACMPEIKWVEVSDYLGDNFGPGEIHAAQNQVIATTRELVEDGYIRFEDVDPKLVLMSA